MYLAAQVAHGEISWQENVWTDATIINFQTIRQICVSINVHKILIYMANYQQTHVFWIANQDFIHIRLKECVFLAVMRRTMLTHPVNFVFSFAQVINFHMQMIKLGNV